MKYNVMNITNHPLFQRYPIKGSAEVSTGKVPTPYHIYAGYGLFIGGECRFETAQRLLSGEGLELLQTGAGHVVMGIWICNFSDASLGPHHELQISFFSPTKTNAPLESHPLNALITMLTRSDIRMLCYGLWNNTPGVVAYNREVLSLNARMTESHIERTPDKISFEFLDTQAGLPVLSGEINHPQRTSLRATLDLVRKIGLKRMQEITRQPWTGMKVLNPLGVRLNFHATAQAFSKNDNNALRYFDPKSDRFEFSLTAYKDLQFRPICVQYMDGFKFVYLNPQ